MWSIDLYSLLKYIHSSTTKVSLPNQGKNCFNPFEPRDGEKSSRDRARFAKMATRSFARPPAPPQRIDRSRGADRNTVRLFARGSIAVPGHATTLRGPRLCRRKIMILTSSSWCARSRTPSWTAAPEVSCSQSRETPQPFYACGRSRRTRGQHDARDTRNASRTHRTRHARARTLYDCALRRIARTRPAS